MSSAVRTLALPSNEAIPVLGQGTWRMAEDVRRRADEIAAPRFGLDLGLMPIDTAGMYAEWRRRGTCLSARLWPSNATRSSSST